MPKLDPGNWWTRPCGGRDVIRLALPLVISTASWTVMNFTDRMFLLWFSTQTMAAAMPAGMLHFTVICFPLGIAIYANTFVAQYHGAGKPERIGAVVWHAFGIGVLTVPVILAVIPLAPAIFRLAGHPPETAALEVAYFQILALGGGGTVMAAALSAFFTGRGATRVVMMVSITTASLNILLDYLWIFGHWGFPRMGIEGAAWATVVSQWFRVLLYWQIMMLPAHREKYQLLAGRKFDRELFGRLLRFGGPNGLQFVVGVAAFSMFIMLVGGLGEEAMAATTLAFNVNSVAFVPMLGMGIAVTTMVGQQLGRNRPDLAARATWTAFLMAFSYMGLMAVLYVAVPDVFLMGHAAGMPADRFDELRNMTVVLLRFVAAYCLLDAANLIFVSAIKGAGDTQFVLKVNAVLSPLPVLAGWIGMTYFGAGLIWCWTTLTAWISALGIIYLARFLQGRWRTMRVIGRDRN
jgi:MATE family multidrug resistance protein